jgi:hypothetical protein
VARNLGRGGTTTAARPAQSHRKDRRPPSTHATGSGQRPRRGPITAFSDAAPANPSRDAPRPGSLAPASR